MIKIYSIQEIISEFGEIPYCKCLCGNLVNINPKYYHRYKKSGYPEYLPSHQFKTDEFKKARSEENKGELSSYYKPEIHKTYSEMITILGEPPICGCDKCKITQTIVNVDPKNFSKYLKYGYPKFIKWHNNYCDEKRKQQSEMMTGEISPVYNPEIHIIHTIEDCIRDIGKIPLCQCEDINGLNCGMKIDIDPNKYLRYKREGYPRYIQGHGSKGKGNGMFGIPSPLTGIPSVSKWISRTSDVKERMSVTLKEFYKQHPEAIRRGKDHPNWIGGTTSIKQLIRTCYKYSDWRKSVFIRDSFTCQKCSKNKCYIEAHHIKYFSKIVYENNIQSLEEAHSCSELWNISNGITLCEECHNETKKNREEH